MNTNISFTSRIRMVDINEYRNVIQGIPKQNFVNHPWTIKQSVLSDKAYTTDILDCTVFGLTDGQQVLLMHICPTIQENKNFNKIREFIEKKINLANPDLQGFILGQKRQYADSVNLFNNFVKLLKEHKIPFSMFKGGGLENHVAYSSVKDEWVIGNCLITQQIKQNFKYPQDVAKKIFDDVKISELDELSWDLPVNPRQPHAEHP